MGQATALAVPARAHPIREGTPVQFAYHSYRVD